VGFLQKHNVPTLPLRTWSPRCHFSRRGPQKIQRLDRMFSREMKIQSSTCIFNATSSNQVQCIRIKICRNHPKTGLAQSVERWPFKPVVVGSSPISGVPFFMLFLEYHCHFIKIFRNLTSPILFFINWSCCTKFCQICNLLTFHIVLLDILQLPSICFSTSREESILCCSSTITFRDDSRHMMVMILTSQVDEQCPEESPRKPSKEAVRIHPLSLRGRRHEIIPE
jgi:hypothetical protein